MSVEQIVLVLEIVDVVSGWGGVMLRRAIGWQEERRT